MSSTCDQSHVAVAPPAGISPACGHEPLKASADGLGTCRPGLLCAAQRLAPRWPPSPIAAAGAQARRSEVVHCVTVGAGDARSTLDTSAITIALCRAWLQNDLVNAR